MGVLMLVNNDCYMQVLRKLKNQNEYGGIVIGVKNVVRCLM